MLYILTEGCKLWGYGHIARCLALYDEAKKHHRVSLVIDSCRETIGMTLPLETEVFNWKTEAFYNEGLKATDCVIIDSYNISEMMLNKISNKVKHCLYIADNNLAILKNGIVASPSLYAASIQFIKSNRVEYLLGADFSILRPPFCSPFIKMVQKKISSILVVIGATDTEGVTEKILESLESFPRINHVTVTYIQEFKMKHARPNFQHAKQQSAEAICELMKASDVVITSGGQTTLELIKLQTPFIAIPVVDNQKNNCTFLVEKGLAYVVANDGDLKSRLVTNLEKLTYAQRQAFAEKMQGMIDGGGAKRIVNAVLKEGV